MVCNEPADLPLPRPRPYRVQTVVLWGVSTGEANGVPQRHHLCQCNDAQGHYSGRLLAGQPGVAVQGHQLGQVLCDSWARSHSLRPLVPGWPPGTGSSAPSASATLSQYQADIVLAKRAPVMEEARALLLIIHVTILLS